MSRTPCPVSGPWKPAGFAKLAEEQQKLWRFPDISQSLAVISHRPRDAGLRLGQSLGSAASWVNYAGSGTNGQDADTKLPSAQTRQRPVLLAVTFATSAAVPWAELHRPRSLLVLFTSSAAPLPGKKLPSS